MRLELDFNRAVITRDDSIAGVVASLGSATAALTFTSDACVATQGSPVGIPCGRPEICSHQAWLAVVVLTGETARRPMGEGEWDPVAKRLSFPMSSGRRRVMI